MIHMLKEGEDALAVLLGADGMEVNGQFWRGFPRRHSGLIMSRGLCLLVLGCSLPYLPYSGTTGGNGRSKLFPA